MHFDKQVGQPPQIEEHLHTYIHTYMSPPPSGLPSENASMVDLLGRNPIRRRSEQMRLGAAAAQQAARKGQERTCIWKPWSQQIYLSILISPLDEQDQHCRGMGSHPDIFMQMAWHEEIHDQDSSARTVTTHTRFIYTYIHIHTVTHTYCTYTYIYHTTYITYIHTYIHIHKIYMHTYTYIHAYIHTYIHTYIQSHIHTYTHVYIHTYKYIHTYINIYIHTYIHTYRFCQARSGCPRSAIASGPVEHQEPEQDIFQLRSREKP